MFWEEKLSQTEQKITKYWYKIFLLKHILRFGIWKNCISKLPIKMFTIKTKAVKAYVYRMLLSVNTSVPYKFFLTSRRTIVSVVKQPSSDITRFFVGDCPMSGTNIQACFISNILINCPISLKWKCLLNYISHDASSLPYVNIIKFEFEALSFIPISTTFSKVFLSTKLLNCSIPGICYIFTRWSS